MAPHWTAWLTVLGLLVLTLGTWYQARTSLAEFKRLRVAYGKVDLAEASRRRHPSRVMRTRQARAWFWWLYLAPQWLAAPAWIAAAIQRAPNALAQLHREGSAVEADLNRWTRQLIGWTILVLGSLISLTAACIALAATI
jgi:hypothetical protein